MRTYHSLAAHNVACNEFFFKFQDCQYEHPLRKFLGYCNDIEKQMRMCVKEQRLINRDKNFEKSKKRLERIRTAIELEENSDSTNNLMNNSN